MTFVSRPDGAEIFYKDWGDGPPVLFSHGWPLNADSWDYQMLYLATHGFRCVAHDRRGHGRSTQTWHGNDMDTYADDLAAVIEALDLRDVTLVRSDDLRRSAEGVPGRSPRHHRHAQGAAEPRPRRVHQGLNALASTSPADPAHSAARFDTVATHER